MKPIIFVSHLHKDTSLAKILKEEISGLLLDGIEFFVSSDDGSIRGGDNWLDKIDGALSEAKLVLILCNEYSISRPWINFEAGGAWGKRTLVIPLCYGGLRPENLPQPLCRLKSFNLFNTEDIRSLVNIISECAQLRNPNFDPESLVTKLAGALSKERENRSGTDTQEIQEAVRLVSNYVGHDVQPKDREIVLSAVTKSVAPLRQLQQRLKDWGEDADEWIKDFHAGITDYSQIFATDLLERSSIGSPQFDRYLRIQYLAKLKASANKNTPRFPLYFSKPIIDAIQRTGWKSNDILWQAPMEAIGGRGKGLKSFEF